VQTACIPPLSLHQRPNYEQTGEMNKDELSGSAPDLSSEKTHQEERILANRRKRGHNDEFTEAFDHFTEKITAMINKWKVEVTHETSQINDKLNKLNDASQDVKSELSSIKKDYLQIKNSVCGLQGTINDIQHEFSSVKDSVQFNSKQYDDVLKKLDDQSKEIKSIPKMNAEISELRKQNKKLISDFNANEQRDRLLNIELVGVPENGNEDLTKVILKLGEHSGINLTVTDIIQVNRVSSKSKVQGRPRNIVAKLRTRLLKDNVISQARKSRVTTKDLDIQGNITPVYVNEHLTLFNKDLLRKVKEVAVNKEYQYAWVKNGRIYVRKAPTMPAILVTEEEDLKKIT
jgi:archaellum component FlaC